MHNTSKYLKEIAKRGDECEAQAGNRLLPVSNPSYPCKSVLSLQHGSRTETPARCNSAFNSRESVTPK
jgi:hypothetical protein